MITELGGCVDMIALESARHQLIEHGLLGNQAGSFGSSDELMLISAGLKLSF